MAEEIIFAQILDYANRANPYPFYTRLLQQPVSRQPDGSYVVSTYPEILALLHDPRVSSDLRNRPQAGASANVQAPSAAQAQAAAPSPGFVALDPPQHDRLRRLAMHSFGPPDTPARIAGMEAEYLQIATGLIDQLAGKSQIDIVDDFAYPLPVTVICALLGVPREDEPRFHIWAETIVDSLDLNSPEADRKAAAAGQALLDLGRYMAQLAAERAKQLGDDLLSGLVAGDAADGRMSPDDLVSTAMLLLIAGHETTVNLITNGMLTMLRHPDVLDRLRREPGLIVGAVEELLRYEPPVHILPQRTALDEITIAGTTIPKGSPVLLVLAAGNRDPSQFPEPDRFDPARQDNRHLGFGSGIHNCFGAPLARLEVQIALTELIRRLENPRLVVDPPPYRTSPLLRGPRHLLVAIDGIRH